MGKITRQAADAASRPQQLGLHHAAQLAARQRRVVGAPRDMSCDLGRQMEGVELELTRAPGVQTRDGVIDQRSITEPNQRLRHEFSQRPKPRAEARAQQHGSPIHEAACSPESTACLQEATRPDPGPQKFARKLGACYGRWVVKLCPFRILSLAARVSAGLVVVLTGASCGTHTSGIEECRQIERARCQSAVPCGLIEDVAACERYVQDQCLHGMPDDLGPSKTDVSACVDAIEDVGSCAKSLGRKADPSECRQASVKSAAASRVCQLVERPEQLEDCRFLGTSEAEMDASRDEDEEDAEDTTPSEPDAAADAAP